MEHINTLCGQNGEFLDFESDCTHSHHCTLNG
jgi:hypothetical protein